MPIVKSPLPGEADRPWLAGLVIFCVACTGGALRLVGSALSIQWLHRIGSGIGVVGAIVFVLYVWWRLYVGSVPASEAQQDEQSPH
jgi:hypothetical protein